MFLRNCNHIRGLGSAGRLLSTNDEGQISDLLKFLYFWVLSDSQDAWVEGEGQGESINSMTALSKAIYDDDTAYYQTPYLCVSAKEVNEFLRKYLY